jgi:hypothetical protein
LATNLPQIVSINNYARGGQRQGELYSTDGQAVVSLRLNCDIKEQGTGVAMATKLPQIVSINNYAGAKESFILRTPRPFPRG